MTLAADLRFKTYLLISLLVCFGPVGDLLMSEGMRGIGIAPSWAPAALLRYALRVFLSPLVWLGTLSMIGYFGSYITVLSWADYSYVQPATALMYVVVAILGRFVLGERVTLLRWLGIAVVFVGVMVIGSTSLRTTEGPPMGADSVEPVT
jgi:drug/metabolite transporter (DMT)-like permease